MFVWMYTLNGSNQVQMITVQEEFFFKAGATMDRVFIQGLLQTHQQYKNKESKRERHRSTFRLGFILAKMDYLQQKEMGVDVEYRIHVL
jgi:hypothetical protein